MKKILVTASFAISLVLSQSPAFAQFSVDWGTSSDTGNSGFTDLNNWFSSNGYSINAETDYIGYGAGDSDPFLFGAGSATFEVVSRLAGNANLTSFGFYTGAVAGKVLTEVLPAGSNGPQSFSSSSDYGIYINTPENYQSGPYLNWFSSRGENAYDQNGPSHTNPGGDPQALIYKLNAYDFLLAWEDLDYSSAGSDRDYNDAYLKVTTTPEPVSMALFGLGAGALGLSRLRRRKKSL